MSHADIRAAPVVVDEVTGDGAGSDPSQRGHLVGTPLDGHRAAGVEPASRGRIHGGRDVVAEQDRPPSTLLDGVGHGSGREQRLGVGV